MVGTSVRDRMNDQTMADITASAIGTNKKRGTPVRKNIGTNTMQMQSSETNAGTTICSAPSRIACLDFLALFEMPVDVFDRHGRFVDEDADGERKAAQGHDVEGFAKRPERRDRAEHRQRNRGGDDQGRAEAAEEQQDHQAGQRGRDDAFADDAADGGVDENRLIADQR